MERIAQRETSVNGSFVRGSSVVSAEILAANHRLLAQRSLIARTSSRSEVEAAATTDGRPLPAHLGWESARLSEQLRRRGKDSAESASLSLIVRQSPLPAPPTNQPPAPARTTLVAHPSLLLALLRTQQAPVARIWLLCRHLDTAGRGWLPVETLRRALTDRQAPLYLCGWRRLRQLLQQGRGVFWERDNRDRLWLYGVAHVAAHLGIERLAGRPLHLPLFAITGSLTAFRAHCYAACHSGRRRQAGGCAPISRATLTRLTGRPARTQRAYDARIGVRRQANHALLAIHQADAYQSAAFRYGRSLFLFHDRRGRHGRPGQTYLARQLPNGYHVPGHLQAARGRQRKINRCLQDLVTHPAQGNRNLTMDRLYVAAPAYLAAAQPDAKRLCYWPAPGGRPSEQIWYACGPN